MQKKWFLVFGIVLILVGSGGYVLRSKLKPAKAGILVESNPQASVFINGEQVGTTPYNSVTKPGEIILKLVPSSSAAISPWDTKLTLIEGIETIVRRDFGESDGSSSGEMLSFEKIAGESSSMAIVSSPDSAQVSVDGEEKGVTPVPVDLLSEGEHKLVVSRIGYKDREIMAKTIAGYKLTVLVMLAQKPQEASSSTEGDIKSSNSVQQLEIQETPTGFLRVRMDPSTVASESGRVKPGEKYDVLEESKDGKWFKVEYEKGKDGWVSAQYAKKLTPNNTSEGL